MLRYMLLFLYTVASFAGTIPFPYLDCAGNKNSEIVVLSNPKINASWTCFDINSIPKAYLCKGRCCKVPYQYIVFDTRIGCKNVISEIVLHHTVQGAISAVPQFYQYSKWDHVFKVRLGKSPVRPSALKSICFKTNRPITDRSKPCRRQDTFSKYALLDMAQKCCPVNNIEYDPQPVFITPPISPPPPQPILTPPSPPELASIIPSQSSPSPPPPDSVFITPPPTSPYPYPPPHIFTIPSPYTYPVFVTPPPSPHHTPPTDSPPYEMPKFIVPSPPTYPPFVFATPDLTIRRTLSEITSTKEIEITPSGAP